MFFGEIAALITALLWSVSSIVFSEASVRIGSQQLNMNRLLFAAFFLAALVLFMGFPESVTAEQIWFLFLSGFAGLVFGDGFLFKSFHMIGARYSMLIMSFVPGISALLGYLFLDEVLSLQSIIGILVTIAGIAMVVIEKKSGNSKFKITGLGFVYGFLGALGQAVGLLLAKNAFVLGEINEFSATFVRIISSIIILFPFMIILRKYKNPVKLYRKDTTALYLTIAGSIIGPFLGITFSLIAISHTEVGIASTLMSTTPILMLPMVKFYYKEKIPVTGILGAFIAVCGIAILFLR
ncbi:MAG TPA: DMT family transporter [Ignavibacteriaceae bacterium]|nr:DMT family transporter [Ignavibacteriaceae bacterium]